MKLNKKAIIWISVLLTVIALGLAGVTLAGRFTDAQQSTDQIMVAVERGDLEVWVNGDGVVAAAVEETVRTQIGGTVETYLLEDGKDVVAGEKLASLELQDLSLQIERAELDLQRVEQELENLEDEDTDAGVFSPGAGEITWRVRPGDWVQRGMVIADANATGNGEAADSVEIKAPISGTITAIEVQSVEVEKDQLIAEIEDLDRSEQIEQQISLKELQIRQARLELTDLKEQQQENRKHSVITAPISGAVVLPEPNNVEVGMNLPQGAVLATIVDYSKLEVTIPVDELDINRVKTGQQVKLTADALPGQVLTGAVSQVSTTGKSQGGVATFDVVVSINPVEGLRTGMNVSVTILVETRLNTLLLPLEAVFEQEGKTFVMARSAEGADGENSFIPVEVTTGLNDISYIEILSGVREGQIVVIQRPAGEADPRDGMMGGFRPGMGQEDDDQ